MTTEALDPAAEALLRELAPRVLGALIRRGAEFAAAEDAVQEALLAAALEWPRAGTPHNPGGWLFHVATRRLSEVGKRRLIARRISRCFHHSSAACRL